MKAEGNRHLKVRTAVRRRVPVADRTAVQRRPMTVARLIAARTAVAGLPAADRMEAAAGPRAEDALRPLLIVPVAEAVRTAAALAVVTNLVSRKRNAAFGRRFYWASWAGWTYPPRNCRKPSGVLQVPDEIPLEVFYFLFCCLRAVLGRVLAIASGHGSARSIDADILRVGRA